MTPRDNGPLWTLTAALCDGTITPGELDQLESLLRESDEARLFYAAYMDLHGRLQWRFRGGREERRESGRSAVGRGSEIPLPSSSFPSPPSAIPPIIVDLSSPDRSRVGGFLFSYVAAAAVFGIGLLIGALVQISHVDTPTVQVVPARAERITDLPRGSGRQPVPLAAAVGRVTGMFDCQWSDPSTKTVEKAEFSLGRRYALASGLMEITYKTGVKVILQGPAVYEVESADSGYLSFGKLTARVESRESRVERAARPPNLGATSSGPSTPDSRLFSIRTPTTIVTDLGTEFGVEVDRSGRSYTRVFRGRVELRPAESTPGRSPRTPLEANESATVEPGGDWAAKKTPAANRPTTSEFVRALPRRVAIRLFNTGVGEKEGAPDAHWQIAAVSSDPQFKPQAAVVTEIDPRYYMWNDAARSQWISTGGKLPRLPNDVKYTFRTTFESAGMLPGTAVIRGQFLADDRVVEIRLNGRKADVPEQSRGTPFSRWAEFQVRGPLAVGTNILELDVLNLADSPGHRKWKNPMAFRAELEGSAISFATSPAGGAERNDKTSMPGGEPQKGPR
jgi:hypothetical protein